jgi:ribosome maturation protein SDO1
MISVEKAVIARLKRKNLNFEILVDPIKAFEFKNGKNINVEEILAVNEVFRDAKKGNRASAEELKNAFGTTNIFEIAKEIIKNGELQITTELKRKLIEEKKKQIIFLISKRYVDPKTNAPHPIQRIENALEMAKVNIDPFLDAEIQLENIIKELKKVLPLKIEYVVLEVKIPLGIASKIYNELKKLEIIEEEWTENYLRIKIKINSAIKDEIISKLYKYTGEIEIREIKNADKG